MSTDYEIRCSCGASFSCDNWRQPAQVAALIDMRSKFASIHTASMHSDMWLDGWDAQGSMFPGIFRFCGEHAQHEMSVRDEYGRTWTKESARRRAALHEEARRPGANLALIQSQLHDLDCEMNEAT